MNQEASRGPANAAPRGTGRPPRKQPARPSLGGGRPRPGPRTARAGPGDRPPAARGGHGRVRGPRLPRRPRGRRGAPGGHLARDVLPLLLQQGRPVQGPAEGRAARHGDRGGRLPRGHPRRHRAHRAAPVGPQVLPRLRGARHRDPHPQPGRPGARGGVRRRAAAVLQHRRGDDHGHDRRRPGGRASTRSTPSSPRWPA